MIKSKELIRTRKDYKAEVTFKHEKYVVEVLEEWGPDNEVEISVVINYNGWGRRVIPNVDEITDYVESIWEVE